MQVYKFLSQSAPNEAGLPTPRLALLDRYYRFIVITVQCAAVTLPLAASGLALGQLSPAPLGLTLVYIALSYGRFVRRVGELPEGLRSNLQLVAGLTEIGILALLRWALSAAGFSQTEYWWALYILPISRLAEVGGFVYWFWGMVSATLMLASLQVGDWARRLDAAGIHNLLGKELLLALSTLVPAYMSRLLLTHRKAGEFFNIATSDNLMAVFQKAMDAYLGADWGALWLLQTQPGQDGQYHLKQMYTYKREGAARGGQNPWTYTRRPGKASAGEVEANVDAYTLRHLPKARPLTSQGAGPLVKEMPWSVFSQPEISSWIVVPIFRDLPASPIGYLEVGLYWHLPDFEWPRMTRLVTTVAGTLGDVYAQVQYGHLKEAVIALEHEARDTADFYDRAVRAMAAYFEHEVTILAFQPSAQKIQLVVGNFEPIRIRILEPWLGQRLAELYRIGEVSVCSASDLATGVDQPGENYLVCPLIARGEAIELMVLVGQEPFTPHERQMFQELSQALNPILTRRRAANLIQLDALAHEWPRTKGEELRLLAEKVKEDTSADVVVLYQFEHGLPKTPPIIVGTLNDPNYLRDKPIVIETNNPILHVAREGGPYFSASTTVDPLSGVGQNRHGDPSFVVREGIVSSVGIPLKSKDTVLGVVWANFRRPQQFADRTYYDELYRQLPRHLEHLLLLAANRKYGEDRARKSLQTSIHDNIIQDLVAMGAYLEVIRARMPVDAHADVHTSLASTRARLVDAEANARTLLEDLDEVLDMSDLDWQLSELASELRNELGLPEEVRRIGLAEVPAYLHRDLYYSIREAILNAVRRGRAKHIVIQADVTSDCLSVIIRDDGAGFDLDTVRYGHGISAIRKRTSYLQGKLKIGSKLGMGTAVVIEIPMAAARAILGVPA